MLYLHAWAGSRMHGQAVACMGRQSQSGALAGSSADKSLKNVICCTCKGRALISRALGGLFAGGACLCACGGGCAWRKDSVHTPAVPVPPVCPVWLCEHHQQHKHPHIDRGNCRRRRQALGHVPQLRYVAGMDLCVWKVCVCVDELCAARTA